MNKSGNLLNIKRMYLLGRSDLIVNWRSLLISSGITAGVLIVYSLLKTAGASVFIHTGASGNFRVNYGVFFVNVIFAWGIIQASSSFKELHDKTRNEAYLLLPASFLEKFLVRLIFVSVILPVIIILLIFTASVITELINMFNIPSAVFKPFNPLDSYYFKMIGKLIIIQSVFLYGASHFKKNHFLKTVLSIILFFISLSILATIIMRIFMSGYMQGIIRFGIAGFDWRVSFLSDYPELVKILNILWNIIIYVLLAPLFWLLTCLKIKRTQSSDGI